MSGTKRIKPWAAGCKARMLSDVIFRLLGFIQGVKMSLPVGFERKDDRKSEEITIPATNGFQGKLVSRKQIFSLEDWSSGCSTFFVVLGSGRHRL